MLTQRLTRAASIVAPRVLADAGAVASAVVDLLRTEPATLTRTTYRPSADPVVIESCFEQILVLANAIKDPVEQAFFVFSQLMYLQPFARLNASMACLAVNIPLLRVGLPPVMFATVRGVDLIDGVRGVWELNRTELLRDVFVAALGAEGSKP